MNSIDKILKQMAKELVNENILDLPRKNLDPTVWDKNGLMKPALKKQLMNTFNVWKEKMWPDLEIDDWFVIGSITTFQYNSNSDIDINMIVSVPKSKIDKMWKLFPNGNEVNGHPVNYYLTMNTKNVDDSKTLYDMKNDNWIRKPNPENNTVPDKYSLEIARFFMDAIDLRLSELQRDEKDLKKYTELLNSKDSYMEEEELKAEINRIEMEIKADKDSIRLAHYIVKGFRKEGFVNDEGKFQFSINVNTDNDSNKTLNNLIYKELEHFDYFKKMEKAEK